MRGRGHMAIVFLLSHVVGSILPARRPCQRVEGWYCAGNLRPAMGARNQVGTGLSYRPASLCSLAYQFQTRFLESIPRPIAGIKIPTL
jgi:hypothetical protein